MIMSLSICCIYSFDFLREQVAKTHPYDQYYVPEKKVIKNGIQALIWEKRGRHVLHKLMQGVTKPHFEQGLLYYRTW